MKKLLQFLMTMFLSVAMVGCYSTEEPVGPDVPVVGSLKLSQEEMTISPEGGKFSVDIFTEYSYKTSVNVDWIKITDNSSGDEYCTLYFTIAKNNTTSEREGVITVFCDDYNLSATLTVTQVSNSQIPNNEIWYTSSDSKVVTPNATDVFGANIVSNTYENGQGVITFDGDVTQIGNSAFQQCNSLTSITIPDSVTTIGDSAFAWCYSLTSIIIPDSVTSIGMQAFHQCESLASITIPNSVTSIGWGAFFGCLSLEAFYGKFASEDNRCLIVDGVLTSFAPAGLTEYTILDGVTSIERNTFGYCRKLTKITIPDSVTSIGYFTFSYCTSLKEVYCKPTIPPIGDSLMFNSNATGRKIYVPAASVEAYKAADYWKEYADYIEGYNFENSEVVTPQPANNEIWYTSTDDAVVEPYVTDAFGANIVSNTYENGQGVITFDNEVTRIGEQAFYNCATLTSISIPSTISEMNKNAFSGCKNLKRVDISDLSAWCRIAFKYSTASSPLYNSADLYLNGELLTDLVIPSDITVLNFGAFYGCTSLESVTIPSHVTSIGKSAFCKCTSLTDVTIDYGVVTLGDSVFANCSGLTEITIPQSVTKIGANTFSSTSLTSVTIPNSVSSIGEGAFSRCASLEKFYGRFASADNCCLIVDGVFHTFAAGCGKTEYTIPAGITAIGGRAFYYCQLLTSVTIPDSVTSIENYAFYWCTSLTDITIPDSVTSIGNSAFQSCKSLTDITIPDSVTSIGNYAFSGCSSLTNIYCKPTTPPTAVASSSNYWRAFNSNASGRKIYVPSVSVGVYRAAQYWSDYADVIFSEDGDDSTTTDSVAVPEDKYPSKTNFKRRIMITQFTGTGCGYCPRIINALYQLNSSSYADDVVLSAAHLYNSSDPAYLSSATALSSSLGITGYPTVCVDMDKSATTGSSYAAIVSLINSANSRVSVKGGIAVNSKYNAETGSISINALVKAKESAEFRIGAWLLEDGVYGQQSNYGITPVDGVDLNTHNNCVRTAYSNQTSSDFTGFSLGTIEAGKTASKEFTFALKPNGTGAQDKWNHDNLRLIVFIATKEGSNWLVNNVVKVPKDGSVDFEYTE